MTSDLRRLDVMTSHSQYDVTSTSCVCGVLFASLDKETLLKRNQLLKKRSVPVGANSFLLECTSIDEKRCKYKISRVASLRLADNTEVNDLRKIKCFKKKLNFLLKEFQFVVSLKIWRSIAYTTCHAPIPVKS